MEELRPFSPRSRQMKTVRNVVTKPVEKRAVRRRGLAAVAGGRDGRTLIEQARPPVPGPGELVVRRQTLALSGVHLALVTGTAGPGRLPSDGTHLGAVGDAGTVIATGDGVTRFAVGDEVFGRLRPSGAAWTPYVLTADGPHVELRPDALEPGAAAALVEGGMAAKTIVRAASVQTGQTALVIGTNGRVGIVLVPLLVEAGVSVIATARPGDEAYIRSLGAAETIKDGARDAMEAIAEHPDVDLLVDLVSFAEPYFATARAIPCTGALVGAGAAQDADDRPPAIGIPRIELSAEPGDLVELAQRALDSARDWAAGSSTAVAA
jgi:NADPH:quinone reductase-like Zn-dependent oxidoreductase